MEYWTRLKVLSPLSPIKPHKTASVTLTKPSNSDCTLFNPCHYLFPSHLVPFRRIHPSFHCHHIPAKVLQMITTQVFNHSQSVSQWVVTTRICRKFSSRTHACLCRWIYVNQSLVHSLRSVCSLCLLVVSALSHQTLMLYRSYVLCIHRQRLYCVGFRQINCTNVCYSVED